MALTDTATRFLFYSKSLGVSFSETLTIGRLALKINPLLINEMAQKYHLPAAENIYSPGNKSYAEPLFCMLGATKADSLDYSDYEGATIIHDMNYSIPTEYKNKYSVVIDGGSLEHIFNFPTAIKNCMTMVCEGGHFISFAPLNNLMGHGLYQFSPELFYRVFSSENGFKVINMFMVAANFYVDTPEWYLVKDPKEINERVMLSNKHPTYVLLLAQKLNDVALFSAFPSQSDYDVAWKNTNNKTEPAPITGKINLLYRKLFTEKTRYRLRKIYNKYIRRTDKAENLEKINKDFFKKYSS
jgi:hypothetical protein